MSIKSIVSLACLAACATPLAAAHPGDGGLAYATDHAPIGVMADHRHKKGGTMISVRTMVMDMSGSRDGRTALTPDEIATTVPNPFAGAPMMPPTLRVVPTDMTMKMHMVGGMYGLTDRITLLAMANFVSSEMDHLTYQGGMGTTQLGNFTTETEGFGDTVIGAIIGLDDGHTPHMQTNLALRLSLPTGSTSETDTILTPMNMQPTVRLPYPMQLGSGSVDLKPALTHRSRSGKWSYGAQVSAVLRLNENDDGYRLGDQAEITSWIAYEPEPWVSVSGRLKARRVEDIRGQDPAIMAPVQTADPANHGGDTVELLFGVNLAGSHDWRRGHRLALEVGVPLARRLNGPQLETDMTFTLGWQKAF